MKKPLGIHSLRLWLTAGAIASILSAQAIGQVTISANFDGKATNNSTAPPDPNAAVGPNHIVQCVNSNISIYDKSGNLISNTGNNTFFGITTGGDPHVIYNEIAQKFAIEVIGSLNSSGTGTAGFAVSDTSDPTGTWHKIVINVPGFWDGFGGNGIGYNADAWTVHVNGFNNQFAMIPYANNPNLNYTFFTAPSGIHIGRPVPMTNAPAGAPLYFVEGNTDGINGQGGTTGQIRLMAVTNYLSGSPTYTQSTVQADTVTASVINNCWRDNQLAVIGKTGSPAIVHWYLLGTSSGVTLVDKGTITPAGGAAVDDPTIAISPNGSLGLNYLAVGSTNTTMFVSGRAPTDPAGAMRTPVQVMTGATSNGRLGDFSSCVVDINSSGQPQNAFWACNEYLNTTNQFDWRTRLAKFVEPLFEAESLTINSSSDTVDLVTDNNYSAGSADILRANAVGDSVVYLVPNISAGTYTVAVGMKKNTSRGTFQLAASRADQNTYSNIGSPIDEYENTSGDYVEVLVGTWSPGTTNDKLFRFTATGKNGSSDQFWISVDYIRLTKQ